MVLIKDISLLDYETGNVYVKEHRLQEKEEMKGTGQG